MSSADDESNFGVQQLVRKNPKILINFPLFLAFFDFYCLNLSRDLVDGEY